MTDKAGAPPCGIYIRIKAETDKKAMAGTLFKLRQMNMAINRASGYARNNHVIEITPEGKEETALLVQIIQSEGAVAIIRDNIALAGELKADGVLLGDEGAYSTARAALGEDAIIGIIGEPQIEADYVVLPAQTKSIAQWSTKSTISSVASGGLITNENVGAFAKSGADFIDVTDYIWSHPKGTMQGVVNILHALELATAKNSIN